jgi:multiple sugar transport system permease protein
VRGETKLPGDKRKRSKKIRAAGWVKDRLKYDTDPSELYPLTREEEISPKENGAMAGRDAFDEDAEVEPTGEDPVYEPIREDPVSEPAAESAAAKSMPEEVYLGEEDAGADAEWALAEDPEDGKENSSAASNVLTKLTVKAGASGKDLGVRARRFWTKKRVEILRMVIRTAVIGFFAVIFLMPIVLTITNSLMTKAEINANYGVIFAKRNGVRVFISSTVNLKFIPDIVSFGQYFKVLILSPEYLLKFWNSFLYVVPIVVFQLAIASLTSYGFARYRGRVREIIFFAYIILMLMPYQVTLVPNYLVSKWLNLLDTRWAIWLPGFFSPFAVYMLTKYMRRIPKSIYEAAEIDGAGEWQIFTKICLPNCRGGIASIAILLFIDYWNMVEQPLILLSDDQLHPLSVFLSKINSGEISLAFAVAVIYMVLPMMVFLYGEEYLVEGIVYQGGIKE